MHERPVHHQHSCARALACLRTGKKQSWVIVQDLEAHLSSKHKGEWVAGPKLTAADIMISYTLGLLTYSTTGPHTPAPQVQPGTMAASIRVPCVLRFAFQCTNCA